MLTLERGLVSISFLAQVEKTEATQPKVADSVQTSRASVCRALFISALGFQMPIFFEMSKNDFVFLLLVLLLILYQNLGVAKECSSWELLSQAVVAMK